MRIEEEVKLDFADVLIRPKRSKLSSRSSVDITRSLKIYPNNQQPWIGVPIIAANMDTVGTFDMARTLSKFDLMTSLHKHYSLEKLVEFFNNTEDGVCKNIFYSMGIVDEDYEKLRKFNQRVDVTKFRNITIDVANGYSESFIDFVKKVRHEFPDKCIMAGNVVTGEITEELILSGVNIVKVGIGPGAVCTTRKVTGVGYPQLSAIIECADAAHGLGGFICGDGGCVSAGDVVKAFAGGADFVMLGSMFSAHDECEGEWIPEPVAEIRENVEVIKRDNLCLTVVAEDRTIWNVSLGEENLRNGWEKWPKVFKKKIMPNSKFVMYGMSSEKAMKKYKGKVEEYRASEGKEVLVDYRGPVKNTIQEILGGLRSACTYCGAKSLKELTKRTTFIKVNRQLNTSLGK